MAYQMIPMYNLEATVGRNGTNNRSDVAVVESLLLAVYGDRSMEFWRSTAPKNLTFPSKMLQALGGTYNDNLQAWIDLFLATRPELTNDGVFSPLSLRGGTLATSFGGKRANFYGLMYYAYLSDSSKFMEIGPSRGLMVTIDSPKYLLTRFRM